MDPRGRVPRINGDMAHVPHGYCQMTTVAQATAVMADPGAAMPAAAISATLPMPIGILEEAGPDGLPKPIDGSMPIEASAMSERRQRRVACDNCRKRKLRCGRALGGHTPFHQPCSNCVERNLPCTERLAKKVRVGGKRKSDEVLPTSYGEMPPMYAQTPHTCYSHPGYCAPVSYAAGPPGAWVMPAAPGVPLEPHPAYAMQPCYLPQQHPPVHAQCSAGDSVSRPFLHGLPEPPMPGQPVMASQSGAMPPQAPAMPPQAPAMPPQAPAMPLHAPAMRLAPAMPPQAPAMPPQAPAMPPQAPAMPPQAPAMPLQAPAMPLQAPAMPPQAPGMPPQVPGMPPQALAMPPQAPGMPPQGPPMHPQPIMPPTQAGAMHPQMPGMPPQAPGMPPQAPGMPLQGPPMHPQPIMPPTQAGAMHPQVPGMPPQAPGMPQHSGMANHQPMPCQPVSPMHMATPVGAPSYPGYAIQSTVLMPPQVSGAYPPYQYAR